MCLLSSCLVQDRTLVTALEGLHNNSQIVFGYFVRRINRSLSEGVVGLEELQDVMSCLDKILLSFCDTPAKYGTTMLLHLLSFLSFGFPVCFVGLC